jgi:hypothetical protein
MVVYGGVWWWMMVDEGVWWCVMLILTCFTAAIVTKAAAPLADMPTKRLAVGHPYTGGISPPPTGGYASQRSETKKYCIVCDFKTKTKDLVCCRNMHAFCNGDFNRMVKNQITSNRNDFIKNECKLRCQYCAQASQTASKSDVYFERSCASRLDDDTYALYEECITERAVIKAQAECELRFLRASKPASQDPDEDTIGKMML